MAIIIIYMEKIKIIKIEMGKKLNEGNNENKRKKKWRD